MSSRSTPHPRIVFCAAVLIALAAFVGPLLAADPLYTRVATLAASDKAHDVVKAPSHLAVESSTGVVVVADTSHERDRHGACRQRHAGVCQR
jgi:hypothetical protein